MVFLRTKDILARYGTSVYSLQRWMRDGRFPRPIKIGGGCRWNLDTLIAWENAQGSRPVDESAAILQALLRPAIETAMILRGPTAGEWLELYLAKRAEHRSAEALAGFFREQLAGTLAPIAETAPGQKPGDAACIAAVAMLSLAMGDAAILADLVPAFAAAIARQADLVAYVQAFTVRIRQAREQRLSLPAIWETEARLLFSGLADAVVDEVQTQAAVDAIFENVSVL